MARKFLITTIGLLLVLGLVAYQWWIHVVKPQAPDVTFTLTNGHTLSLQQLRGRPVLVTFWSVSCVICIAEMPELINLYKQLNPAGLEIIGVAMPFDRPESVLAVQKQQGINYKIALDVPGLVVSAFHHVVTTPESFLISPEGMIVMHKQGKLDILPLSLQIQTLINKAEK